MYPRERFSPGLNTKTHPLRHMLQGMREGERDQTERSYFPSFSATQGSSECMFFYRDDLSMLCMNAPASQTHASDAADATATGPRMYMIRAQRLGLKDMWKDAIGLMGLSCLP